MSRAARTGKAVKTWRPWLYCVQVYAVLIVTKRLLRRLLRLQQRNTVPVRENDSTNKDLRMVIGNSPVKSC